MEGLPQEPQLTDYLAAYTLEVSNIRPDIRASLIGQLTAPYHRRPLSDRIPEPLTEQLGNDACRFVGGLAVRAEVS